MNEKIIRGPNFKIIGRIRDTPGRIEARKSSGVLIGWYDKQSDITRYSSGEVYSFGNAVSMLLGT